MNDCYDIDILFNNQINEIKESLIQIGIGKCETIFDNHGYFSEKVYDFTIRKEFGIEYKIQLIHTKDKFDKFIENSDMDILKNYFDAHYFYISNLDSIINKVAIYDNKNQKNKNYRCKKYKDRGYKIININESELEIDTTLLQKND
uniref:Uncharacterized protein n=1 Tax=viral metagenome TaxID=1070528 RepID=A0A6C0AF01_9ZZZZ